MIERRRFILSITLGFAGAPALAIEPQQTGKVYRVGLAHPSIPVEQMSGREPAHSGTRALVQALRDLGYAEGLNLVLERRSADGRVERYRDIVAELVGLNVDVIVTSTSPMNQAAKAVTTTVPIVMVTGADPVRDGIVQSLARPGGNITGLTATVGTEIEEKRLQLLKEAIPGVSRVAYLASKENNDWDSPHGRSVRLAAQALGVTLVRAEASIHEFTEAFKLITGARIDALFVSWNAQPSDWGRIAEFAKRARLPSTFYYRESVELGGLMSYGLNGTDNWRRAAGYVDKILKGAKPADLPIGQPTRFEFVINLKTAKAIGLAIPQSLLVRADALIR